jgi:hypothetical protein
MKTINVILKVLLLSTALSVGIKYLAPHFNIPPTTTSALIAVFLPTLVMAGILGWHRWQRQVKEPQAEKTSVE